MKKNPLLGLGATAILVAALTACGGGTAATPEPSSAPETPSATPTPVKQYTEQELVAIAQQVKASDGSSPAVLTGQELAARYDTLDKTLGKTTIDPANCKDMGMLGVNQAISGSTTAGTERKKTAGIISDLTLTSGVELKVLQDAVDKSKTEAGECKKVSFSSEGQAITTTTESIDGVGSVPGTVAYKTVMSLVDGSSGAIYRALAIKDGVLISVTSSGSGDQTGGAEAAGAMLDQAAALIK
ncbi:hypothetical protein [Paenarthrobacter ilicis]|uniref:PknH-like extracellular domain-containing protein n=1 Tax=Paenarthrobacter ilicis TaxID=43665 RepID=A0ABX0TJD6_9MICC|nr:hypothetical protein [Paenarthrobacter ilicis]MBM7794998.1 hypothetical protein [Paenarthrobacter ilicis]NIJ02629.1 hypothetical protein [Paenarthrobacter ilicis]